MQHLIVPQQKVVNASRKYMESGPAAASSLNLIPQNRACRVGMVGMTQGFQLEHLLRCLFLVVDTIRMLIKDHLCGKGWVNIRPSILGYLPILSQPCKMISTTDNLLSTTSLAAT